MSEPLETIIDKLFARARADCESAPLAAAFASAYRGGQWTADELDAYVRSFVEEHSRPLDADRQEESER
jgi:hypothetical protein